MFKDLLLNLFLFFTYIADFFFFVYIRNGGFKNTTFSTLVEQLEHNYILEQAI